MARIYNESNNTSIANMTDYITTRWYRAPEVIVGFPSYTFSVDIWAVGCILVELITRQPLFPGSNSLKQLELITRRLGKPSNIFIQQIKKLNYQRYFIHMPDAPTLNHSKPSPTRQHAHFICNL